jgi:hypothetical protein
MEPLMVLRFSTDEKYVRIATAQLAVYAANGVPPQLPQFGECFRGERLLVALLPCQCEQGCDYSARLMPLGRFSR